jgi:RNA polymerase sigma-70 factor, ECF subfamily
LNSDHEAMVEMALRQAGRGDNQAFAEIVSEYQAMIFSIGWHFLGDRALAEDLAQDVFLELYQGLDAIQSAAHLKYWLRRVAVNRAIDYGRRKKSSRELALEEVEEPATGDAQTDALLSEKLRQALAKLPEKQRMILILRYQEDRGPTEIAELLKVPVSTVKSALQRGLEELRGKLARKLKEVRYAFF